MAALSSILAALGALKQAGDISKALVGTDVSFARAELKVKIADLAGALADARMAVLEAKEEIGELENRVRQLEARADVRSRLLHKDNAYFLREEGGKESGPYCVACFEREERLIHLTKLPAAFAAAASFQCPGCRAPY